MSDTTNLKQKTFSGLFWQFSERVVNQLISFGISVLLARKLMPEEFGLVALAGMFTVLIGIFIDCGFGTALIQKKDADNKDFSTIFWTQLVFSTCVYFIVFCTAPWFSQIFHEPKLVPVLRVSALGMIVGAIGGMQNVQVTRQMAFKVYFYRTLIGNVLSGIIGVILAYNGWGVWALVAQHLSSRIINIFTVYFQVRWLPSFYFSLERFKALFAVGAKFMLSSLIGTAFSQLRGYLIGWKYKSADLGYYNRGEGIPALLVRNINSSINSVLFPAISKLQDDPQMVKRAIRRAIKTSTFVLFPMLLGLAAVADNLVVVLYTEKWIPAIPFMQVFCIYECFSLLNVANLQVLRGMGKVNTILKLEFYKKPVMIAMLIVAVMISPLAIAVGMMFYSFYTMIINAFPNRKFISYSLWEQVKDVGESFLLALGMAVVVYFIGRLHINLYVLLIVQIICGAVIYFSLAKLFHVESLEYVKSNIGKFLKRK